MIDRLRKLSNSASSSPKTSKPLKSEEKPADHAPEDVSDDAAAEAAAEEQQTVISTSPSASLEGMEPLPEAALDAPLKEQGALDTASGKHAEEDDLPEGCDWKVDDESADDEVRQVRPSAAGTDVGPSVSTAGTPNSGTSSTATHWEKVADQPATIDPPVVIPADASLLDGLRALLVHHLRRSAGSHVVNLTAGQAELLEHHLNRLASYAQKIVHTLAFATRFLSSQQEPPSYFEGDRGEMASPNVSSRGVDSARAASVADGQEQAPHRTRKLRLRDNEILDIYRSAQQEASKEADWRGIAGPGARSDGGCSTARSETSQMAAVFSSQGTAAQGEDVEFVRAISRAMQQPGRTPEAFTAEMLGSSGSMLGCCQSKVLAAQREAMRNSSAVIRWPQVPPDPGARRYERSEV
eukprot:gb/GFBE01075366.1/.p1 GENE.gb/GFBE01075366.1/~~gb/GFBE01075366.1/.p1  ORF type:complete len:410 (+),score=82.71 gb/GFBE01075366.1/:1-1230(+)